MVENNNGELRFPAILYDAAEDESWYTFWPVYVDYRPLQLPREFRSTDYYCEAEKCYFVLASNGSDYLLTAPAPELERCYQFTDFLIPTKHPVTQESISWRGGVFVNESKKEVYLIGASGTAKNQTVHIISYNYVTKAWTLSSAEGFSYDLMSGSWALLTDGRLMCAGGSEGDNFTARKDVCIFTPTEAGTDGTDSSQSFDGQRLIVWLKSGDKVSYDLADVPVTTFSGSKLIIQTNKVTIPYERKDVLRYTYEDIEETGIDLSPSERRVEINREGDEITFRGLQVGGIASIYAINGILIEQRKVTDTLPLTISLKNRPNGVYIVKAGTETIKVMKR
jgi:hypothetical protein